MNSRERLLTVLAGGLPDRVPVSTYELVGYNSRAWENHDPSYARLMDVIRDRTDCICMWNPSSNATFLASSHPVELEVETRREGRTTFTRRTMHTPQGELTQRTRSTDDVHTVWQTEHWCKTLDDVERALSVPYEPVAYGPDQGPTIGHTAPGSVPDPEERRDAPSDYERIRREVGHRGIIMSSLSDPLYIAADLMPFGDYTVWAMTEPEHFGRTVDTVHERVMQNLGDMLETCPVDLYRICGPEYATPPFLPPALFQRFVVPYVRAMVDLIHAHGAQARLHCHGRIGQVLGMIAATGTDGLDPCEGPPDGDIALGEVKRQVGDRVCLYGNLQLKLLEHGTVDEVEAAVEACMDTAKAGGRYVIMPTAAPINTPLSRQTERNYLAFIETALRAGAY